MTTRLYKTSSEASKCLNEYNDCVVKAVSIATGIDYLTIHTMFKKYGRINRKGTHMYVTDHVMNRLVSEGKIKSWREFKPRSEYYATRINASGQKEKYIRRGKWSMKTIGQNLTMRTTGICFTSRHAAAMVNNEIHDWTEGRRHVVEAIYVIEK